VEVTPMYTTYDLLCSCRSAVLPYIVAVPGRVSPVVAVCYL